MQRSFTRAARREPVLPPDREPCTCTMLRTMARRAKALFDEHLAGSGLNAAQYTLLAHLDRVGTCSLSELADDLEIDVTSASRSVRVLVDGGLVETSPGKDARTKAFGLTREGRRRLRAAYPAWQRFQAELAGVISADHRAILAEAATAIVAHARKR